MREQSGGEQVDKTGLKITVVNFLELKMFQATGLGEPCLGFLHGLGCEHGDRAHR